MPTTTSLTQKLAEHVAACFPGLWIQSHEHQDALTEIAQLCRDSQWQLATWDIDTGLSVPGQTEQGGSSNDPLAAIKAINALATPEGTAILVLQIFHRFLQSAEVVQALSHQINTGKQNRAIVIVLSPVVQIPTELERMFVVIEHDLPHRQELEEIARGIATDHGRRGIACRSRVTGDSRCSSWTHPHGSREGNGFRFRIVCVLSHECCQPALQLGLVFFG